MKKFLLLFSVALLLVGCSSNKEDKATAKDKVVNDTVEKEEVENKDVVESEEQSEGGLTEIGQVIKEAHYSVELLKIKNIDETLEKGPLSLDLIDAKLIRMFDLSEEMKRDLQEITNDSTTDEIAYVQLQYKVKNKGDEDITWYNIYDIVTDQGKQVSGNDDFLSQEFVYDIYSGVEVDYLNGYFVEPNTDHLRLIFSPVYKYDTSDELAAQFEYEFSFDD